MTRSLWPKFMAAFALVIVAGVGLVVLLVSRATAGQFALYVTRSGQQIAVRVAPNLEAYYSSTGSWNGVETLLADPWTAQGQSADTDQDMMGNDQDMMGTGQHGQMMGAAGVWAMFGSRLILADAQGAVVADTGDALVRDRAVVAVVVRLHQCVGVGHKSWGKIRRHTSQSFIAVVANRIGFD